MLRWIQRLDRMFATDCNRFKMALWWQTERTRNTRVSTDTRWTTEVRKGYVFQPETGAEVIRYAFKSMTVCFEFSTYFLDYCIF